MSDDLDYLNCPHCGQEAVYRVNRWGDHIYCGNCGYSRETIVTNLDQAGTDGWMPDVHTTENTNPFGAYYVVYKEGHADAGSLIDETSESHLMQEIEKHRLDIVYAHIKEYIDGEHKTRVLIDTQKVDIGSLIIGNE